MANFFFFVQCIKILLLQRTYYIFLWTATNVHLRAYSRYFFLKSNFLKYYFCIDIIKVSFFYSQYVNLSTIRISWVGRCKIIPKQAGTSAILILKIGKNNAALPVCSNVFLEALNFHGYELTYYNFVLNSLNRRAHRMWTSYLPLRNTWHHINFI